MAEINVLAQARTRLLKGQRETVAGALTDRPDDDMIVQLIKEVTERQGAAGDPLNAVELEIAELVDAGETYPIGNTEAFQGVRWLAQVNPTNLPNPMPRDFALYFALAWKQQGRYGTVTEGLQFIFDNFTFV